MAGSVFVGNVNYRARKMDLERFFKGYGRMVQINIRRGYAFVEFEDSRDASVAVSHLHGRELMGVRAIVEHARTPHPRGSLPPRWSAGSGGRRSGSGPPMNAHYRLIVENLSRFCRLRDLKDHMSQAGELSYADAHRRRPREGVVEYRKYSDVKRALDTLQGTRLYGKRIYLTLERRARRGSGTPSQSRSRGRQQSHSQCRSRSRSGSRRSRSPSRSSHSTARQRSRSLTPRPSSPPAHSTSGSLRAKRSCSPHFDRSRSASESRSRRPGNLSRSRLLAWDKVRGRDHTSSPERRRERGGRRRATSRSLTKSSSSSRSPSDRSRFVSPR